MLGYLWCCGDSDKGSHVIDTFEELVYYVDQIPPPDVWRNANPENTHYALQGITSVSEYIIQEMLSGETYDELDQDHQFDYHSLLVGYLTQHWDRLQKFTRVSGNDLKVPGWLIRPDISDQHSEYNSYLPLPELEAHAMGFSDSSRFNFKVNLAWMTAFADNPCKSLLM